MKYAQKAPLVQGTGMHNFEEDAPNICAVLYAIIVTGNKGQLIAKPDSPNELERIVNDMHIMASCTKPLPEKSERGFKITIMVTSAMHPESLTLCNRFKDCIGVAGIPGDIQNL